MPFRGGRAAAARALAALYAIDRGPADELILVDNTPELLARGVATGWPEVRVVDAAEERSSYYARNVGAAATGGEWLLFIDSDCWPEPDLLTSYLDGEVAPDVGALAGQVLGDPSQTSVFARYQRHRGHLELRSNDEAAVRPSAVTANLLVRAATWRSVGGFAEGVRSGGDRDFTWRLQDAGWRLEPRPQARVTHSHRDSLRSFAVVTARYGAGREWLDRRHPGTGGPRAADGSAVRALGTAVRFALKGQHQDAVFRVVDALVIVMDRVGSWMGNRPPNSRRRSRACELVVIADRFPELSETFIVSELEALARAGMTARVEAGSRAGRLNLRALREHSVDYRDDDALWYRAATLLWLALRHPVRMLEDIRAQRRWRGEETVPPLRVLAPAVWRLASGGEGHLHAHFADGAALTALRLGRFVGRPYSVTAHAYEIFKEPRNLREKLERATFVTTGCRYNVAHLRRIAPAAKVELIVMGVDTTRIQRRVPYSDGRSLVAVGRLIEKKGFAHLINAMASLNGTVPISRLAIVGDGPLRKQLWDRAERLGLGALVRWLGALSHEETLAVLEHSALLVMPAVIASDGDRDSMPVVVKEALALEVPVVASDEVGLPEVVRPEWGRLVPPGDPAALAKAIAQLLALPTAERAAMGRAGRAHVAQHCDVDSETARLVELIKQARSAP
jgi:colanic acid/amylovoran biosynthesis glycosyltransferase